MTQDLGSANQGGCSRDRIKPQSIIAHTRTSQNSLPLAHRKVPAVVVRRFHQSCDVLGAAPLLLPPPPQHPLREDWLGSADSSSTMTTLRLLVLLLRVRLARCSISSACCIMRCVRSRNMSSTLRFCLAEVCTCTAPTCFAYLWRCFFLLLVGFGKEDG